MNVYLLTRIIENAKKLRPASLAYLDHATNSFIEKNIQGGCNDCVLMQYIPRVQQSLTIREIRKIIIRVSDDRCNFNNVKKSHIFTFFLEIYGGYD